MSKKKGGYGYLAKNFGVLTIAQFGSKILSFLLVPLYTAVLTPEEYGLNDLFTTSITLLIPILTLNVVDATIRYAIDEQIDKRNVFSISVMYITLGTVLFLALLGINTAFHIFKSVEEYWFLIWLHFITSAVSTMVTGFARGIDRVTDVAVSGIISTVVLLGSNILLLLVFKVGLTGYLIAICLGPLSQILYLAFRLRVWNYMSFNLRRLRRSKLRKEMIRYARPLIANALAWWINSASDRYIVTWLCGVSVNGIYSVGYKIPSILAIFTNIFNQAWTLSAVKDFDPEDTNHFFTNMYNLYNFAATFVCSALIASTKIAARILYSNEFYTAWQYVPFLLMAFVFSSLSGYLGGIFSAVKDSKIFARSTLIGAVVNIILNIIMVYTAGAIGAAIATLISYIVIWVVRVLNSKKYVKIKFRFKRDFIAYAVLVAQSVLLFVVSNSIVLYISEFVCMAILLLMFRTETKNLIRKIKK